MVCTTCKMSWAWRNFGSIAKSQQAYWESLPPLVADLNSPVQPLRVRPRFGPLLGLLLVAVVHLLVVLKFEDWLRPPGRPQPPVLEVVLLASTVMPQALNPALLPTSASSSRAPTLANQRQVRMPSETANLTPTDSPLISNLATESAFPPTTSTPPTASTPDPVLNVNPTLTGANRQTTETKNSAGQASNSKGLEITGVVCLQGERPRYPRLAQRNEQEGTVILRVVIGVDGKIQENAITVQHSSGYPLLDQAALASVKSGNWSFTPAYKEGQAVSAALLIPFPFILNDAMPTETTKTSRGANCQRMLEHAA